MFLPSRTHATVPCPTCSAPSVPSAARQCARCLSARADLTSPLPRRLSLLYCPGCVSYLHPDPKTHVRADPDSKQLLSICLDRVRKPLLSHNLNLVHADFVRADPRSNRISLRLRVQGAVDRLNIVEQTHLAEIHVLDRPCDSCSRAGASPSPDQWLAKVQLRQRAPHRRAFLYLEQLILKHHAADKATRIRETAEGIDFMFPNRTHALKFADFVSGVVPAHSSGDRSASHDTLSLQICPIWREDLVCLPPAVSRSLGNIGPLVVCANVTDSLALLDPSTLRVARLDAREYWRAAFDALMVGRQMVEYVVLDVDGSGAGGTACRLAYVQVARVSDFGKNDNVFTVKTHLGHLLSPGDYALGYDMCAANINNGEVEKYKGLVIPDVILVKKSYEEKRRRRRGRQRAWKLKTLGMEVDTTTVDTEKKEDEYEQFLRDLEENPELRFNISLYRDKDYHPSEMASTEGGDDGVPTVPLEELLAELNLNDTEGCGLESHAMEG
ncbi:60S ribosomal export protein NMD3 [Iris pallida]|uniref:60S ribosomal export protein NMD3 n=1 Tax=Iris pallida TaxID=29817 RepID=A0AAX6H3J5_IRIPA|nr:60S ribosomal export protein NMD3 [Iris pallida]